MITVLMHRRQKNHIDDDLKLLPAIGCFIKLLIYKQIKKFHALYSHGIPEKYTGPEVIPGGKKLFDIYINWEYIPN
jgi:hypothetical protein